MLDKARFKVAFKYLATALRLPAAEAGPDVQRVYFDRLADLPTECVEAAAKEYATTAQWFPKASEWRTAALKAKFAFAAKALPAVEKGALVCVLCSDTGFVQRDCVVGMRCGRTRCVQADEAYTHTYAVRCDCRESNPAILRDRLTFGNVVPIGTGEPKALIGAAQGNGGK